MAVIRIFVQGDHGHGVCAAVRYVKRLLIRGQSQAVGIAAFEAGTIRKDASGRRGLDLRHDAVLYRVHDHDRIAVVGGRKQQRARAIHDHFSRLAVRFDPSADGERWLQLKHNNFTITQAGNISFVIAGKSNSVWIFASGYAFLRGIDFARTQVKLAHHLICFQIDERNGIILVVRDKQAPAIWAHGQPGNHWIDRRHFRFRAISDSQTCFVAQR